MPSDLYIQNTMRYLCGCPKCRRSLYAELKPKLAAAKLLGQTTRVRQIRKVFRDIRKNAGKDTDKLT